MGKELACHAPVAADWQGGGHGLSGKVGRPPESQCPRDHGTVRHTIPWGADVEEFSPLRQIGHERPQVYPSRDERLLRSFRRQDPFQANAHASSGCAYQIHGGSGGPSRGGRELIGWRILEADAQRRLSHCLRGARRDEPEEQELTDYKNRWSVPPSQKLTQDHKR